MENFEDQFAFVVGGVTVALAHHSEPERDYEPSVQLMTGGGGVVRVYGVAALIELSKAIEFALPRAISKTRFA